MMASIQTTIKKKTYVAVLVVLAFASSVSVISSGYFFSRRSKSLANGVETHLRTINEEAYRSSSNEDNLLLEKFLEIDDNDAMMKEIENVQNDTCWRKCPQRINRIYYTDPGAGLGDRKILIRDLAEIAGYLCAKLILSRPSAMLNPFHNFNKMLSDDLTWWDFDNITFAESGEPAIIKDVFDMDTARKEYEGFLHVVSTDGEWHEDFKEIQTFTWWQEDNAKTGFLWELHEQFYFNDLTRTTLPLLPKGITNQVGSAYQPQKMEPVRYYGMGKPKDLRGCHYTSDDSIPSHMSDMREIVLTKILQHSLDSSTHGLLHLRRGDVVDECDTSIARLETYLSCSLENTDVLGNFTLLMTSDEEDDKYRQDVQALSDNYSHVKIVDVDKIIQEVIDAAITNGQLRKELQNNYYVFEVGSFLRTWETDGLVKFYMVRRRKFCTDCIPVKERLDDLMKEGTYNV